MNILPSIGTRSTPIIATISLLRLSFSLSSFSCLSLSFTIFSISGGRIDKSPIIESALELFFTVFFFAPVLIPFPSLLILFISQECRINMQSLYILRYLSCHTLILRGKLDIHFVVSGSIENHHISAVIFKLRLYPLLPVYQIICLVHLFLLFALFCIYNFGSNRSVSVNVDLHLL